MKNLCALSLAISANLFPADALAGAWLQDKGSGQIISSVRVYGTLESFDEDGNRFTTEPFVKVDLSSYFEYGLHEKLTLGGEIDYAVVNNQEPGVEDITDLRMSYGTIFARAYIDRGDNYVVSIEPAITFPKSLGNDLTSDGEDPIPELKLSHGYSFEWREQRHFIDNSIKYRLRGDGELEDMLKFESTLGLRYTRDYTLLVQMTYEHSLGDVEDDVIGNYDLLKPQLSVLHDIGYGLSHQLGVFTNIYGQNTGAGYGAGYSFWVNF